jgi:hypothetical protein
MTTKRNVDPSMYLGQLPPWVQALVDRLVTVSRVDWVPCCDPVLCSLGLGSQCAMDWHPVKDGHAGGLEPEYLATELPRIQLAAGKRQFKIELEVKLRNEADQFDLSYVGRCLKSYAFRCKVMMAWSSETS